MSRNGCDWVLWVLFGFICKQSWQFTCSRLPWLQMLGELRVFLLRKCAMYRGIFDVTLHASPNYVPLRVLSGLIPSHLLLPSGNLTVCYWTWWFIVSFPIKHGDFPVRYVKLPEGKSFFQHLPSMGPKDVIPSPTALHPSWFPGVLNC